MKKRRCETSARSIRDVASISDIYGSDARYLSITAYIDICLSEYRYFLSILQTPIITRIDTFGPHIDNFFAPEKKEANSFYLPFLHHKIYIDLYYRYMGPISPITTAQSVQWTRPGSYVKKLSILPISILFE